MKIAGKTSVILASIYAGFLSLQAQSSSVGTCETLFESRHESALSVCISESEQGDGLASYYVGKLYMEDSLADKGRALKWFQVASGQGIARASEVLGYIYEDEYTATSMGQTPNKGKALAYYKTAYLQGGLSVQEVGHIYLNDPDLKSVSRARQWYISAAEDGDISAMRTLYSLGSDLMLAAPDREHWALRAVEGMRAEASAGDLSSMKILGGYSTDLPVPLAEKLAWLQKIHERGYADGLYEHYLLFSESAEHRDSDRAAYWLQRIGQDGAGTGLLQLAGYYSRMLGNKKHGQKLAYLYEMASSQGSGEASYKLAEMNRLGEHTFPEKAIAKNADRARAYYIKAADQGYVEALKKAGEYYLYGTGIRQDIEKGLSYLRQASNKGVYGSEKILDKHARLQKIMTQSARYFSGEINQQKCNAAQAQLAEAFQDWPQTLDSPKEQRLFSALAVCAHTYNLDACTPTDKNGQALKSRPATGMASYIQSTGYKYGENECKGEHRFIKDWGYQFIGS